MFEKLNPNKVAATSLAAIAIAGGMASKANAQPDSAHSGAGIEKIAENNPIIKEQEELQQKIAENKLHFRVLNLAVSFSITSKDTYFYSVPHILPPYQHGELTQSYVANEPRTFFFGQYPGQIHSKGKDWLIFVDQNVLKTDVARIPTDKGPALNPDVMILMRADKMPKDTKIYSIKRSPLPSRVHSVPGYVDSMLNIGAKGLPTGQPEMLLGFSNKREVDNIVNSMCTKSSITHLDKIR